jgi:UDP-N-acetylglucosamine 2-epimerase (non-hydrolysing)
LLRVVNVVGTRPNLVKMAGVLSAQRARPDMFAPLLVHTGQHRDPLMSDRFFRELELPEPDVVLPLDSAAPPTTERMQRALETVLGRLRPDLVVVVGDVNSTAAGALAARALSIPLVHVEAGLRSFDDTMPEERNRILVDALSDLLFASEQSGVDNLLREGRPRAAIHLVGNVMIDALVRFRDRAVARQPAAALGVTAPYALLTLHRPANVDAAAALAPLLEVLGEASQHLPIIFPVHPRTRDRLDVAGLTARLAAFPGLHAIPPLGYLDMLALMRDAHLVLTDSGGIQEETTFLGVPCLTLREATERPATVVHGTNRIVGVQPQQVRAGIERILSGDRPGPVCPPLWDGQAAQRIAAILAERASARRC